MTYKILCIDGGGIKGVFALQLLQQLQEDAKVKLLNHVDCLAGTSTGALIVSSFSAGFKPKDLIRFYQLLGSRAFPYGKNYEHGGAKYDPSKLKKILTKLFAKYPTLADVKRDIIIPTCSLCHKQQKKWYPEVFDNFDREKAKEYSLVDVALRSSAAPIYYPSYQNYVDGGIFALNPSLVAFSSAIDPKKGNQKIEDVRLLSIGTGVNPVAIHEEVDWDEVRWMKPYHTLSQHPLFSLMTEVGSLVPEYPLQQMLKGNYQRVNGFLPSPIEIDDATRVPTLIKAAKNVPHLYPDQWRQTVEWVKENFR